MVGDRAGSERSRVGGEQKAVLNGIGERRKRFPSKKENSLMGAATESRVSKLDTARSQSGDLREHLLNRKGAKSGLAYASVKKFLCSR